MSNGASTNQNIAIMLKTVREDAITAGLMTDTEELTYERGSARNGVAPGVWVMSPNGTGYKHGAVAPFLPRFHTKHTGKDVLLALEAAHAALFAVNHQKEK